MSRTYKIYHTQGDRRNVSVEGVCRRADGKTYSLMMDGTIVNGMLSDGQKSQIWNFRLSSTGEIPIYTDGKKRSFSMIYTEDQQEIALIDNADKLKNAFKMKQLILFLSNHPEVAVYKFSKTGERIQTNINFNPKAYKGIHFVLIDETAIEEEEFSINRKKRQALGMLDEIWDICEQTKNFQPLIDINYGLNTSARPYLKQPIENYNKIEDFINRAPERFISFIQKKAESSLVVLFRKSTMGIVSDKEPLISLQNGGYYFNNTFIGKDEAECIYYLRTNPKIKEYLESALDIRKSHEEIEKNEIVLEKAIGDSKNASSDEDTDLTSEVIAHAEKWIEKIKKAQHVPERMNKRFEEIKKETDGYSDEQNRIAFKDYFNASAKRNELPEHIRL